MSYPSYGGPGPTGQPLGALAPEPTDKGKKGKNAKTPNKRVIDRQIIFAGIFALLVAGAVVFFMSGSKSQTYVVRAKVAVNALTPLTVDQVEAVPVDPANIVDGALQGNSQDSAMTAAKNAFVGGPRTKYPLAAKQQITNNLFGPDLALATPLGPDERLVSVTTTVPRAVAGQIQAGDTVDVIGTANSVTGLIAGKVPVVSVTVSEDLYNQVASQQTGANKNINPNTLLPGDPVPGIYVLRVPSSVALKLMSVQNDGKLTILYQGSSASEISQPPVTSLQAICGSNTTGACKTNTPNTTP